MLKKPCAKCGVAKPPSAYHIQRNGNYFGTCKSCHSKDARRYYHEVVKLARKLEVAK